MSIYKTFYARGTQRYMKDGKLISPSNLTPQILKVLQNVPTYDDTIPEVETNKTCVFCGKKTNLTRFINLQTLYICREHYETKTVGQTAQRAKELVDAKA